MHLTPLRPIDISFVGSLDPMMALEVSALQELGIAVETAAKTFKLSHLISGATDTLPSGITKYISNEPAVTSFSAHFEKVRIALLFDRCSVSFPDLVQTAVNAGCYVIVDEGLAQKNRWLTPNTYGVLSVSSGLISSISNYITDSITDLFMSVELASRGQTEMSLRKFDEVKEIFSTLSGVTQFAELQYERLKRSA